MLLKTTATVLFLIIFISKTNCTPAAAHLHSHTRNALNEERVEDGHSKSRHSSSDEKDHDYEFDHQSILGSVKDAEEFDTLPPEEAKKRLAVLVTKMDLNHDKFVDQQELKAWIIRSFRSLAEEEAEERFEDIDENNDKLITWKEYLSDFMGGEPEVEDFTDQLIEDDKEIFEASDLNKDGYLNLEEFSIFNRAEENPITKPILLKHTLRDKDTNNDGFVDFQEYLGTRGYDQDKEWILSEKTRFEHDYDKDKDGKLNNAELLAWFIPDAEEMAIDEVDHLLAAADDDQDRVLSYDEIIEHHVVFVGSEATDYGSQLHKIKRDEL